MRRATEGSHHPSLEILDQLWTEVWAVVEQTEALREFTKSAVERLQQLRGALSAPRLRVVVLGLLKSGKSLFNNTLSLEGLSCLPTDVLPATAGVVRIEDLCPSDAHLCAWLEDQAKAGTITGDGQQQPHNEPPVLLLTAQSAMMCSRDQPWHVQRALALAVGPTAVRDYLQRAHDSIRGHASAHPEADLIGAEDDDLVLRAPLPWLRQVPVPVEFVDSPGANEVLLPSVRTIVCRLLEEADMLLYVMDANCLGSTDEQRLLTDVANLAPSILRNLERRGFFLLNKLDRTGLNPSKGDHPEVLRLRRYVQRFLAQHVAVDGHPLEIQLDRIQAISGHWGYLARSLLRQGSPKLCSELDQKALRQVLYGFTPPDEGLSPERLIEDARQLWKESNCGHIERLIKTFISSQALPVLIQSLTERFEGALEPLELSLRRRQLTGRQSVEQLDEQVSRMLAVLRSVAQGAEVEHTVAHVGAMQSQATELLRQWHERNTTLTLDDSQAGSQVEYPTAQAAQAAATELADNWYRTWLARVVTQKCQLESELAQLLARASSTVQASIEDILGRIFSAFMVGSAEDGEAAARIDALRQALSAVVQPTTIPVPAAALNVAALSAAVQQDCKQVSYQKQEGYLEREAYNEVVWETIQHREKRWCASDRVWTERRPKTRVSHRSVPRYRTVTRTRTDATWKVSPQVVVNFTQTHCRHQADALLADLANAVHGSFAALQREVEDVCVCQVNHFAEALQRDLARARSRSDETRRETQLAEALLEQTEFVRARLDSIISANPVGASNPALDLQLDENLEGREERIDRLDEEAVNRFLRLAATQGSCIHRFLESTDPPITWAHLRGALEGLVALLLDTHGSEAELGELLGEIELLKSSLVRVCVAGLMKAGKSTLLNALMGACALPDAVLPETAQILHIEDFTYRNAFALGKLELPFLIQLQHAGNAGQPPELTATDFLGDSPGAATIAAGARECRRELQELNDDIRQTKLTYHTTAPRLVLAAMLPWLGEMRSAPVQLIDTPGFNEAMLREAVHSLVDEAVKVSEIVVYVLDCTRLFQEDEAALLAHLQHWLHRVLQRATACAVDGSATEALPLVFVINKMDQWRLHNPGQAVEPFRRRVHEWLQRQLDEVVVASGLPSSSLVLSLDNVVCTSARSGLWASLIEQGDVDPALAHRALKEVNGLHGNPSGMDDPGRVVELLRRDDGVTAVQRIIRQHIKRSSLSLLAANVIAKAFAAVDRLADTREGLDHAQRCQLDEIVSKLRLMLDRFC